MGGGVSWRLKESKRKYIWSCNPISHSASSLQSPNGPTLPKKPLISCIVLDSRFYIFSNNSLCNRAISSSGLFIPPSSGVVPPVVEAALDGGGRGGWNEDGDGVGLSVLGVAGWGTFDIELEPAVLEPAGEVECYGEERKG